MKRYRTREVTVGRDIKQQTRFYPQYQEEYETTWNNFTDVALDREVYYTSLAESELFLDTVVEEEVIHEYLPSSVHIETRFTTSIAREDDF